MGRSPALRLILCSVRYHLGLSIVGPPSVSMLFLNDCRQLLILIVVLWTTRSQKLLNQIFIGRMLLSLVERNSKRSCIRVESLVWYPWSLFNS